MKILETLRDGEQIPLEFAAVRDVYRPRMLKAQERLKAQQASRDYRELLANRGGECRPGGSLHPAFTLQP